MHFKKMTPLSATSFVCLFVMSTLLSCGDDPETKKPSFDDYEYSAVLRATITSNGTPSSTEGYVAIDENGEITIETLAGTMTGTVQETADGYTFTITESTGGFADVTGVTGTIDLASGSTTFAGTNPGGTSISLDGEVAPVPKSDGGWDDLEKSSVIFTHSEPSLLVSITIDGETFDGLNAHYHPGGRCDSYYALGNSIPANVDDLESELFCNSGTLKGLNGQPVEFTDCSTIRFVLNKETRYTYTAEWSDGTVTTDEFKSPSGGRVKVICPATGSGGSTGSCSNKANTFKIGSQSYSVALRECDVDGTGFYMYAESSNESEVEIFFPSKPTKNGSYTVIDSDTFDGALQQNQVAVYAYSENTEGDYYSSGGGTLSVTMVSGNVQVDFCKVAMKDFESSATVKVSGKFGCQ
jgi:hypothetical protein